MEALRLHRERLRALREGHLQGMRGHWEVLGEPGFRSGVVNGAVRSIWQAWRPLDTLKTIAGDGDLAGTAIGLALGGKRRTVWGRLLAWVAGALVPMAVDRLRESDEARHFAQELQRSWGRVKDYVKERRAARQQGPEGNAST